LNMREFDRDVSPMAMRTEEKKWFHVSTVVLHRKGTLDKIVIHPGRTMKIIATILGPIKKYVGKEIMISTLEGNKNLEVDSQVTRICENDNIGFQVKNRTNEVMKVFKNGQDVALLSVWATVKFDPDNPPVSSMKY